MLTCACGSRWWTQVRQCQVAAGDYRRTDDGAEVAVSRYRVMLVCAGCGAPADPTEEERHVGAV